MNFTQEPPELGNQFTEDRVLKNYLRRKLPDAVHTNIQSELENLGELVAGELFELVQEDRSNEPQLQRWGPWGNRVDEINHTRVWKRARKVAVDYGLVADAYDRPNGNHSRIIQFAKVYLFGPSSDTYSCPLAMTDGAGRTLLEHQNEELIERALPHLTSRDHDKSWTSGQWMTETTGGSDVGRSRTEARREDDTWRLYGRKWFTSAATADMALTLARPEGNPEGGEGLALFYIETKDENGQLQNIKINRLKEKLGTKELPTAELSLEGTRAIPVNGLSNGIKNISPMLNITRTWNAVNAIAGMRRGLALARDFSRKREAFGDKLSQKPLHVDTLAGLQAEYEAAFHLTFRVVELLSFQETDQLSDSQEQLLRVLTPIAKLLTAKQSVRSASEILECFGGAGYVEDTGLPKLLRDSQVLPIWEGTTNVLSLDFLRSLKESGSISGMETELNRISKNIKHNELKSLVSNLQQVFDESMDWLEEKFNENTVNLEASARRFAFTIGRCFELALLCEQAQWGLRKKEHKRPLWAAKRFFSHGLNKVFSVDVDHSKALGNDVSK